MRLSRTFVGSNDLSVSAAEATLNWGARFHLASWCWPGDPGTHYAHPSDDVCLVDMGRQGVGKGAADSADPGDEHLVQGH